MKRVIVKVNKKFYSIERTSYGFKYEEIVSPSFTEKNGSEINEVIKALHSPKVSKF